MPAPRRGDGSAAGISKKKRLSAQGNNLTKFWGTPVSSKVTPIGGVDGGRNRGDGVVRTGADATFEWGETPDRPSLRGAAIGDRIGEDKYASSGVVNAGGQADVLAKVNEREVLLLLLL